MPFCCARQSFSHIFFYTMIRIVSNIIGPIVFFAPRAGSAEVILHRLISPPTESKTSSASPSASSAPSWAQHPAESEALRPILMRLCAHYLLREKKRKAALDPVAKCVIYKTCCYLKCRLINTGMNFLPPLASHLCLFVSVFLSRRLFFACLPPPPFTCPRPSVRHAPQFPPSQRRERAPPKLARRPVVQGHGAVVRSDGQLHVRA
jgi:hypothetical protein